MNPYFVASIIREGVLGGGISTDEEKMTYHTNKLTVSPELKRIEMRYADIIEIGFQRRFLFPVCSIRLKDNRKDFYKRLGEGLAKIPEAWETRNRVNR